MPRYPAQPSVMTRPPGSRCPVMNECSKLADPSANSPSGLVRTRAVLDLNSYAYRGLLALGSSAPQSWFLAAY